MSAGRRLRRHRRRHKALPKRSSPLDLRPVGWLPEPTWRDWLGLAATVWTAAALTMLYTGWGVAL